MKEYEITYSVNPSLEEDKRAEIDAAVDAAVDERGGKISFNTESMRRKMMYPIQKQRVGFVRVVQAQVDPANIEEIRNTIRRLNGIMRVSILQTSQRGSVTPAIFEIPTKPSLEPKKATDDKPAKEITDQEVEEKIEEALEETIK